MRSNILFSDIFLDKGRLIFGWDCSVSSLFHAFSVVVFCHIPVYSMKPIGNIIGSPVIMLQIVSMLPNIEIEYRAQTFLKRSVLIRGSYNPKLAPVAYQPCIPGSENRKGSLGKFFFKSFIAAEGFLNSIGKLSRRLLGRRRHILKKEAMVIHASRIVSHLCLKLPRESVRSPYQLFK